MNSMTQIASALGVSTATVSKALNNKPGVSYERAEMIRQYAKRRGYRPSYLARSLLKGSTEMIGLCFRVGLTAPWYANVAQNIQHEYQASNAFFASAFVSSVFFEIESINCALFIINIC